MIVVLLLFSGVLVSAQEIDFRYQSGKTPFPFGVVEEISSEALSEKRTLNIYLPQGYHPDSLTTYPVIYLLDGSAHEDYPHIAGLAQFMNMYELLPKSIVVGIVNVDRYRDFTFPSNDPEDKKGLPTSGGSQNFISFLEKELQPFIQENYKVNGHRTIIGQSLGGLLATEILFKKPHLFHDYIIVSPSLWWDGQSLVNRAATYLNSFPGKDSQIFVSLGKEHPTMHEVADKLVAAIRKARNQNLQLFYEPILDEDHATILHSAVYRALKKFHPVGEKH